MELTSGKAIGITLLLLATALGVPRPSYAIPAFARKYDLPCSACHDSWPKLNNFGQVFRDNGYQLGDDHDSPIYQHPSYFPITLRAMPQWQRMTNDRVVTDVIPGNPGSGQVESNVATSGFSVPGVSFWTAGTVYKNISFAAEPFLSTNTGEFSFVTMFARLDNLLGSHWLNVKFGKFELDNLISERRMLTANNVGATYYNYHFRPAGDNNYFSSIGDSQTGVELMGHSSNSYTRYSVSFGQPQNDTFDMYANFSQGFEISSLGLQRVGVYTYVGRSPTLSQTDEGATIAGTGRYDRTFYRAGAYGLWDLGKFDFSTLYLHGQDDVFLGNAVPGNQPLMLPPGAASPSWNGGFAEVDYIHGPKLALIGRYELIRMSRQANPSIRPDLGDLDAWTVGYRLNLFMNSRAGLAWVQDFSRLRTAGTAPITGRDTTTSAFFSGFDLAF